MECGNLHSKFFIFYVVLLTAVSSDPAVMHYIIENVDIPTSISG